MIKNIISKPLRLFYNKGDASKLPALHVGKIEFIMTQLDLASAPEHMDFPGSCLHKLSGQLKDFWAVKISANYRIIFKFEGEDVIDVDYLDYH